MKRSYLVGRDKYTIDYVSQSDGTIRLHADLRPADPHGAGVAESHLYLTGEICVSAGNAPTTMDRAKAIAVHWMEGYSEYVRSGEFPTGRRRVHV